MKGGGPTNLGLLPINFFFDPIPVDLPFLVVVMMMMMDDLNCEKPNCAKSTSEKRMR